MSLQSGDTKTTGFLPLTLYPLPCARGAPSAHQKQSSFKGASLNHKIVPQMWKSTEKAVILIVFLRIQFSEMRSHCCHYSAQ